MPKRELLPLFDLADRKGYDVTPSTMRDHVRLVDKNGNLVKNKNAGAAHSYAEARRYLKESRLELKGQITRLSNFEISFGSKIEHGEF